MPAGRAQTARKLRAARGQPAARVSARAQARGPTARSLGAIVGSYKAAVSKRINHIGAAAGGSVWHRNFYEHVIRNEKQLHRIRRYIEANPANWAFDRENPDAHPY